MTCSLNVKNTEMRCAAKALALVALSELAWLMTHFRCFRSVFKQHIHQGLPGKISSQASSPILGEYVS